MVIKNIRKTKYGYNLFIDEEKINIENSVFSKYMFKKNDAITKNQLDNILKENEIAYLKRRALNYLTSRKSTLDFKKYLYRLEAPKTLVDELVKEYTKKGYLNDYLYAEFLILKEEKRYGKNKIKEILINKGINNEIIDELLFDFKDKNLEAQIIHECKYVKADNYYQAQQKIARSFLRKGYNLKDINHYISLYLNKDNFNEDVAIKKQYEIFLKRYSKRYSGYELNIRIKDALYKKGFSLKSINKILGGS